MMKIRIPAIAAAFLCCMSCVEINNELGGGLIPVNQTYKICEPDPIALEVDMRIADSLSGFSSYRMTLGAIRDDAELGLTRRASAVTLVPLYDTLDFGKNAKLKFFRFTAACDSVSVEDMNQANILQNVYVHEVSSRVSSKYNYNGNADVEHGAASVVKGHPIVNGKDSLVLYFTDEFASKYMNIKQEDLKDINTYLDKFPGIYLETDSPSGKGGRINMFKVQLDYDTDYGTIEGNYAQLSFNAEYDGVAKDTSFLFWFSPTKIYDIDSLLQNSSVGALPQYCRNITIQDAAKTAEHAGKAGEEMILEGGGGLKPVISAKFLKEKVSAAIAANGDDPKEAIINKASLIFPVAKPDEKYELMYKVPVMLSPVIRQHVNDTTEGVTTVKVEFDGLTDSSSSDEDQGDINRSLFQYSPDITYHLQSILTLSDDNAKLNKGDYDIWLMVMNYETLTTTTSSDSDLSDYYTALAYQSYYNSMYSSGYSSYGDSYTNYYTYMMMAQYASSSSTSTSTTTTIDSDRYYYAKLYGPTYSDTTLRPRLTFTYSVPKE